MQAMLCLPFLKFLDPPLKMTKDYAGSTINVSPMDDANLCDPSGQSDEESDSSVSLQTNLTPEARRYIVPDMQATMKMTKDYVGSFTICQMDDRVDDILLKGSREV